MIDSDAHEYVIAPWGDDSCELEVMTVELPSRGLTAQVEVPVHMLERTAEISDDHGIPVETALAERLEINRSRVSLWTAKSVRDTARVREHLEDARGFLSGVEHLNTDDIENSIATVWMNELAE